MKKLSQPSNQYNKKNDSSLFKNAFNSMFKDENESIKKDKKLSEEVNSEYENLKNKIMQECIPNKTQKNKNTEEKSEGINLKSEIPEKEIISKEELKDNPHLKKCLPSKKITLKNEKKNLKPKLPPILQHNENAQTTQKNEEKISQTKETSQIVTKKHKLQPKIKKSEEDLNLYILKQSEDLWNSNVL